jgi:hypothetical protein
VKVIITGDWHGDWSTLGLPRFNEVERAVMHTVSEAIRLRAGLYVFTGDLAETEGPGMLRTLELAVRAASELWRQHIESFWLTGNHDVIEDGQGTSNLTPLRDVPGATLVDRPQVIRVGQRDEGMPIVGKKLIEVACLPFTPRTHGYSPAEFVREKRAREPDLVVGHLMLEGIGPGSETRDMPRGRDVFWPIEEIAACWPNALKVGAHYHRRQVFRGVHLPGSLCRLMQVEASNEPSYLVGTL